MMGEGFDLDLTLFHQGIEQIIDLAEGDAEFVGELALGEFGRLLEEAENAETGVFLGGHGKVATPCLVVHF